MAVNTESTVSIAKDILPASWYKDSSFYELERRAIFSKTWILVSHNHQFTASGQYVRYEIAGYPLVLIRDRQGNLNAFLNVCRHRAFPLVHEDAGSVSIFACKYHGWSYGLSGNLAKAPRFDTVPEFNKADYSLFKVNVHIDVLGFIWVNLDTSESPAKWETQFGGVDALSHPNLFSNEDYAYDHTWSSNSDLNWKTLVENSNKGYQRNLEQPETAQSNIEGARYFKTHSNELQGVGKGETWSTFTFPNTSLVITPHFFYLKSILPLSSTKSLTRFEVYRNKKSTEEEFSSAIALIKKAEEENEADISATAAETDSTDGYVIYFRSLIRSDIGKHIREEKEAGREIWPARRRDASQQNQAAAKQLAEDEELCRGVCSSANNSQLSHESLVW